MRRLSWILAPPVIVVAAMLFPQAPAMAVPMCFGQPATKVGTSAANTLNGTAGVDVIVGLGGNDTINGRGGNDLICGGDGADTVSGGTGNDQLGGGAGADTLSGNENDDDFYGGTGNDSMDGGSQTSGHNAYDELHYDGATAGITANLSTGTASGQGADTFTNMESLFGSSHNDHLTGNAATNYLNGAGGGDTLEGDAGDDVVTGGPGDDAMVGGSQGSGGDTANYLGSSSGVSADLLFESATGAATGTDWVSGFENLYGTAQSDVLFGDGAANTIFGFGGADEVHGDPGPDTLFVNDGDTNDSAFGDDGSDTCWADVGDALDSCESTP